MSSERVVALVMATEVIDKDRFQKVFEALETRKTLLTNCTEIWKKLSSHFSSLEESLLQKSKALDSKIEALDSETKKTLEALEQREKSIPERESAAIARVQEQKEAALAEFEKTGTSNLGLAEALRSYCRKMDSPGLLRFLVAKRKESPVLLRAEISLSIAESVDPARLILDAMEDFINQKSAKGGVPDRRWACGMMLQAHFPATDSSEKAPVVASSIGERAYGVAEAWKAKMDDKESGGFGPAEATMFLQLVAGFGLRSRFEEEFLRKLVLDFPSRKEMPKLAASLGFGEKMGDIIDELVKNGKEIEAIYFASESGLTERFPPLSLLKSYLRNSRRNATTILKNGHYSAAATEEASVLELNSIKAIIKCVEDHKLEAEFTLDSLKKRLTQLEKAKADRKKNMAATSKPQNKRGRGGSGGGPPNFRPSKAGRPSNSYPSYGRRGPPPTGPAPPTRYSGVAAYNYPSQNAYEGPPPTSFASPYGAHSQNPTAPLPQPYAFKPEDMGAGGVRAGGSYGGQTGYGAYDYGAASQPTYPPSYPQ
ncbi:PREDICTED: FRIGIDA-like protein 4a [Nelumbo nucifera]|uniref:FRIGIDA-like protein n=1 Tax=Nelumbo nucifera TaxID=4432 RepID=A0A1U7ZJK8_NELNU|nr:PREDICTED: FRIGIDA-like protein 4a [Nelumbo nucifera]